MSENILKIIAVIAVLAIVGVGMYNVNASKGATANVVSESSSQTVSVNSNNGGTQKAVLKMVNYEYVMEPSTLRKGVPVELEVDLDTVYGCMRDVVISEFKVRKTVSEGNNIIKFTPDKAGTFPVVCSMNMGRGSFSVTDDGIATLETKTAQENFEAQSDLDAGSCGGSSGGCGC